MSNQDDRLIVKQNVHELTLNNTLFNEYIKAATSDHTRRAYRSDVEHYERWGGRLPASPEMVLAYLQAHAESLNPRTLARRLVALRHWHNYQNFDDPTRYPLIQKTLLGITRVHGTPKERARPITPQEVKLISVYLKGRNTIVALRDRALILIGFFGALRRSELIGIHHEHLKWVDEGLDLLIPVSKTDQQHEGQYCAVPFGNSTVCPVGALTEWLEASAIENGPIFRPITSTGNILPRSLTPLSVNHILKKAAKGAGINDPEQFSSHSLRRGLATSAARSGAPLQAIMRAGRWKQTNTVMEYIDASDRFNNSAARNVLDNIADTEEK